MPVETWIICILIFMIVGSIVALELKDILSAIISIGVVGLGVSTAFLFLQAPDLAIVQFLFEIFAMIILLNAFVKGENQPSESSGTGIIYTVVTVAILAGIFLLTIPIFRLLPPFGEPLLTTAQRYLEQGANETGAANLVAAVILDYRAHDTLGEVTVLFAAILGCFTVLRVVRRSDAQEGEADRGE